MKNPFIEVHEHLNQFIDIRHAYPMHSIFTRITPMLNLKIFEDIEPHTVDAVFNTVLRNYKSKTKKFECSINRKEISFGSTHIGYLYTIHQTLKLVNWANEYLIWVRRDLVIPKFLPLSSGEGSDYVYIILVAAKWIRVTPFKFTKHGSRLSCSFCLKEDWIITFYFNSYIDAFYFICLIAESPTRIKHHGEKT